MNINLREPSTKRGIVMLITGATVLYQTFWGSGTVNIDAVLARVDWWLGIGLTIVGMLGFLPDRDPEKRTRETDLPPIELQGRSESPARRDADSASQPNSVDPDLSVFDGEDAQRVRRTGLPPDAFLKNHEQSVRSNQDGYNG